jgi:D-alanine--poly(phosphoribitol) ligase subunit 1
MNFEPHAGFSTTAAEARAPGADFNWNPAVAMYRNSLVLPDFPALVGDGLNLSYREAAGQIRAIARALGPAGRNGARVAILGSRSVAACLALMGALWTGATYVPLGLKLPEERLIGLMRSTHFDALICDGEGEALLTEALLEAAPKVVLLADRRQPKDGAQCPFWRVTEGVEGGGPAHMSPTDLAYIEFTSGTTGVPKGVMLASSGVHHFITVMQERYRLTVEDRVAETTDLSFDVSVSNMFLTWNAGASLHVLPAFSTMFAIKFVNEHQITHWFSVPSVIALLQRNKTLAAASLPTLRHSLFAGEPLPAAAALAWAEAAPNSIVENLYGPTEATIVCIGQAVSEPIVVTPERGIIALGNPFPGMQVAILDPAGHFLPPGEKGEIALSGPQVAVGYLDLPQLTAERFPTLGGRRWYLTGDFGYQDDDGLFHHLGRIDNQVKVRGYRVELEEVDVHLRRAAATSSAAAVAWPSQHGSASGLVAFVAGSTVPATHIKEAMRKTLPSYMTPNRIVELDALPLNPNGKIDRKALLQMLDSAAA